MIVLAISRRAVKVELIELENRMPDCERSPKCLADVLGGGRSHCPTRERPLSTVLLIISGIARPSGLFLCSLERKNVNDCKKEK